MREFLKWRWTDLGERRLAELEHWSVAALRDFDDDRFVLAVGQKVLLNFLTQPGGMDANQRVLTGVVIRRTAENFDSYLLLVDHYARFG